MQPFDVIRAEFRPARTDDLRDGSKAFIGRVADWQCLWIIEDGPYRGQGAMAPRDKEIWPFAWAPMCDLSPHTY